MKKVFISLINFNSKKETVECLQSLQQVKRTGFSLHVLVIDNASSEKFELQKEEYKDLNLEVIVNNVNSGFAGGHNIGMRYALENNADYIVILNNDTIVEEKCIKEMFDILERDALIGIAVPKIYFAKGYEYHKDRYSEKEQGKVLWYAGGVMDWKNAIGSHKGVDKVDEGQYEQEEKTELATGACMMVRLEVMKKVKGFDERYFLYYEDADLSMKIKSLGLSIVFVPTSVVWHKNAASAGGVGSNLHDYYISRNRLLFGMTYAPLRTRVALMRESMKILFTGREWQKKGVTDFYLRKFGKGSYSV